MRQSEIIKIGGVEVILHFRFSTLYKLGRKWGLSTVDQILDRIVRVSIEGASSVSLEAMDVYGDILITCSKEFLEVEDVQNFLFENPEVIVKMTELLIESIQGKVQDKKVQESDNLGK